MLALSREPDFERPREGASVRQWFRDVDAAFHRTLLVGSRNELFLHLSHPVAVALNHRMDRDWAGGRPGPGPTCGTSRPSSRPSGRSSVPNCRCCTTATTA
ncbi:hypothetical protein KYY02_29915 [Streptomyces pimonensis]|uniref:Uncharacterized protein n=1 Tax=Streptomyces pimonensis TaxID=2860288 RepID=A0ABV4J707_9ACTN